jgi:hypothetical protein
MEVVGRFMVRRSTQTLEIERVLLARPNALRLMRVAHEGKRLARRVIGENLYHHLWGAFASRRTLEEVRGEYEPRGRPQ